MTSADPPPERRTPAKGVRLTLAGPNWVFLTVCAEKRDPWLNDANVHSTLHRIWEQEATAWLVSDYLLMPDHLHLFCAPGWMPGQAPGRDALCASSSLETRGRGLAQQGPTSVPIERWVGYWKERFAKTHGRTGGFQKGGFHHRLRDGASYTQKWHYVRENPLRAGLVARPEDWPYQGRVHEIHW